MENKNLQPKHVFEQISTTQTHTHTHIEVHCLFYLKNISDVAYLREDEMMTKCSEIRYEL